MPVEPRDPDRFLSDAKRYETPQERFKRKMKNRHQNSARYTRDVRRHTKVPGYFAQLPKAFPYYVNKSVEEVRELIDILWVSNDLDDYFGDSAEVGTLCFAYTRHVATLDGHVTLWLSAPSALYLLENAYLEAVYEAEF